MGHVLTSNGVKIDPEKAKAVQDMPKPEDVEGIQRVNGFVNYLAKFLPHLADVMEPLRRLTRKDVEWQWAEEQDNSFEEVKKLKQGIGSSPAQRLMNRRTKTLLPTTNQLLQLQARKQAEERAKLIECQQKQKWYYDRTAKDLKPLEKGDAVRMKPLRPGEKKWRVA